MTERIDILVLEDSRFDAELLREYLALERPGASLTIVSNEEKFIAALEAGPFDAILSDFEIPGYGGDLALEQAKKAAPATPFIFVSGVIGEENAVELLKKGATDYVSKGRLARLPVVLDRALRESADRAARSAAEHQLRVADAMFSRVIDSLPEYAVIVMDALGNITSANHAAEEIFGYSKEDIAGRSAAIFFSQDDQLNRVFEGELGRARAEGRAGDSRWMLRKDGSGFWADGILAPIHGDEADGGEIIGFAKILRDGTDAFNVAKAVREARDDAQKANLVKDRFLAVLSHELRTPLTPIGAAAHMLERSATVPDEHRHLLPMIRRNVALEARLIDDLLDLTTLGAGKISLKVARMGMHRLITVVLDMLADQISERQLRIVSQLNAPQNTVMADEARMHQVVWNILRNAIKFTPPGGQITLRTFSVQDQFFFSCADSGIGIEPAALTRIFTAFEQADAEVSHQFGGLGLGLAIARELVALHGGELVAMSEGRGQGATFTLTLEALAEADFETPSRTAPLEALPNAEAGCKLLLVEDNPDSAEILSMGLEAYGYNVTLAGSCAEAIHVARAIPFDIVVTDLGLPDGSGLQIGRALSATLPVIALSGYGSPQDIERSTLAGFSGHIVKPAEFTAVHSMVQKVLAAAR